MPEIGPYAQGVASLGPDWLWWLLALNWAFSAIHVFEEWKGSEFPLWRAFGAVEGVYLPNWLGFASFTVGLLLILWLIGFAGIVGLGLFGPLTPEHGMFWLGAVIGALLSDSVFSHWIPWLSGYRPNPGVRSTALYVLEAAVLLALFWKGLSAYHATAAIGALLGTLFFLAVWGVLVIVRLCIPGWRRPPWISGQPIPSWARE